MLPRPKLEKRRNVRKKEDFIDKKQEKNEVLSFCFRVKRRKCIFHMRKKYRMHLSYVPFSCFWSSRDYSQAFEKIGKNGIPKPISPIANKLLSKLIIIMLWEFSLIFYFIKIIVLINTLLNCLSCNEQQN